MFQTSIDRTIGFGIPGALFLEGPLRGMPAVLQSGDAANNVMARAFTIVASGTANFDTAADPAPTRVAAGGTGVFAGILADPHVYSNAGTAAGGTLAQNLTLPNGTVVELVEETAGIIVQLIGPAAVGDKCYFRQTDGVILTAAPAAAAPAGSTRIPGGTIVRFPVAPAGGGLAVMAFNTLSVA